ncbi:MAG: hypothetical protein WC712_09130 [Candidatus Brocadiia bacterium]
MTLRQLGTALMLVFFCALTAFTGAESAAVDVKTGDAWFGVYVDGVKQGSMHITVEKKKGATAEYYSIVGQENRAFKVKDKEVTEAYDYKAALGLDLKPMSYEALETKGTAKNTIKAKVAAGVAEITIQFGTAAANPPRKVNLTEGDCWSFCAPYMFAARKYAMDKPRRYGKIVEVGCAVISFNVAGAARKMAFQGADTAATEWVETESQKFTLIAGEEGTPLWWSETTKAKVTTKYVCEPEEVAKSKFDFDQFQKQPKEETKPGVKKPDDKTAAADLKGTPFENALKAVKVDEEGDDILRKKAAGYTMRLADEWTGNSLGSARNDYELSGEMVSKKGEDDMIGIGLYVTYREKKDDDTPLSVIEDLIKNTDGGEMKGTPAKLKLDDKTTVTYVEVEAGMMGVDEKVSFYVMAACTDTQVFLIMPYSLFMLPDAKQKMEELGEEMYSMMGSFRIVEPVEAE